MLAPNGIYSGTVNKYYKGKFNAYQRTYVITLRDERNSYQYARFALEYRLAELKRISKGTNTKYLTLELLNNIRIPLPPRELQSTFAHAVAGIESLRASHLMHSQKLDDLVRSLQRFAFRGELNSNEESREFARAG